MGNIGSDKFFTGTLKHYFGDWQTIFKQGLFRQLAAFKDAPEFPEVEEILRVIRQGR